MKKNMQTKKAFTLIELLVGMGIVSVLIGMSLLGINIVQQSTRNTQRMDVLNNLNIALTAIYVNTNSYPTTVTYTVGTIGGEDYIVLNSTNSIKLNPPLKRTNPGSALGNTTGSSTNYCYTSTGSEYWIGVQLEDGTWKYITNSNVVGSTATCADAGL
jgi:prepilin-type N-terminal cleavage/methylation domain-containing protein